MKHSVAARSWAGKQGTARPVLNIYKKGLFSPLFLKLWTYTAVTKANYLL